MERLVYTVPEAAEVLRVSADLIYKLVRTGEIPHRRLGRRVLIPKDALHELLGIDSTLVRLPEE